MRFYTETHAHYCGIDLHAKTMHLCILDRDGAILFHENRKSRPEDFLSAVAPYRDDLVVAVECMFTWYWLADLCRREGIEFVLGHARHPFALIGALPPFRTFAERRRALFRRFLPLPRARRQLDDEPARI